MTVIPRIENIREAFPDLAGAQPQPVVIDGGQNAYVLDFDTHIVRVARFAGQGGTLFREAEVLTVLAPRLPLPVPNMTVREVENVLVAVHPKVPGTPLWSLDNINSSQRAEIASQLGAFLRVLHTIDPAQVADLGVSVEDARHWERWIGEVQARLYPLIDTNSAHRFDALATRFLDEYHALPFALRHGDFGSGNILADGGRITGVIDFGSVAIGDAASDIAGLAASYGDSFLDLVRASYPPVVDMRSRVSFYRVAFAAMEALHGLKHDDPAAIEAGVAGMRA